MFEGQPIQYPNPKLYKNPFLLVREELGMSITQIAQAVRMNRNTIIRTEQGQYDIPSQDLLDFYWVPSSQASVLTDYETWRQLMRRANYGLLEVMFNPWGSSPKDVHPLKRWREISGITALNTLAKAYCLHQAVLFRYETQPNRCNATPPPILAALRDSGYTEAILTKLETAYQEYKLAVREAIKIEYPGGDLANGTDG